MNPSSDIFPVGPVEEAAPEAEARDEPHANWREALMALIASRLELIQLESKQAGQEASRRAVWVGVAAGCAFAAWMLLLAGGVSLISEATRWPWNWVAVGLAGLHLIVGFILARAAKSAGTPAFPATRAEFQKDREWIENFNKPKKSSD
ncbi:MAG: phage holin family protein [Luteolibacter sp.]